MGGTDSNRLEAPGYPSQRVGTMHHPATEVANSCDGDLPAVFPTTAPLGADSAATLERDLARYVTAPLGPGRKLASDTLARVRPSLLGAFSAAM